jgi:hypothetical protein
VSYFWETLVYADDPFTPDVVEPSIPFIVAVSIHNSGAGKVSNLIMESGMPEIVENDKGLLINFKIVNCKVSRERDDYLF